MGHYITCKICGKDHVAWAPAWYYRVYKRMIGVCERCYEKSENPYREFERTGGCRK